jgi:hypothetical protein
MRETLDWDNLKQAVKEENRLHNIWEERGDQNREQKEEEQMESDRKKSEMNQNASNHLKIE